MTLRPPRGKDLRRPRSAAARKNPRKGRRWRLSTRIMLAQLGVLLVVAGLSFWLNVRLASSQLTQQYEDRATAVGRTIADMPQVIQALSQTGPASAVQPIAFKVANSTGAAFVVVVNRQGIRFSDPNPALVGKWFGQAVASLDGRVHVRVHTTNVANVQAAVPVFGADETVIGQVGVGYQESQVAGAVSRVLPAAAAAAGAALLLGVVVSFILARQLKRITFGLELDEIADLLGQAEKSASEQAALQRVATLVATGVAREEVFAAVAQEVGQLANADVVQIYRYEPDKSVVRVAVSGAMAAELAVGDQFHTGGHNVATLVLETGKSARIDDAASITGDAASFAEKLGIRSVVGVPIEVSGRVWGLITVSTTRPEPMAMETEQRIVGFTKLAATAIANAQARADLTDSRRRVVSAADEMRRKIERNLHDGSQQRLVTLSIELREIYDSDAGLPELRSKLAHTTEGLSGLLDELREVSRGLHPAILSEAGLGPALKSLARRASLPVELHVDAAGRLPEPVEVTAYYVASEALANAAKYSKATVAEVTVTATDDVLRVCVRDDGVGGANLARGSGIVGLRDRVESLGGTITVDSPPGQGTLIAAEIPLALKGGQSALSARSCPCDDRVLPLSWSADRPRVSGLPR
jgi:signal transduction histidine kinase